MLSRVQFGVSVGLHYLFPITTLGLAFFILIFESLYLVKRREEHRAVSVFLAKLLGMVFTMGVATGLMLPFSFGANWARFSVFAGSVFGPLISIEASSAFALEASFMAILIFGRNKVSPLVCWFSALCVFLGAHLSAFLIVAANSWLQTPSGFVVENGRAVMTSLTEVVLNHSTLIRFFHVVTAAWLSGACVVAGIAAYYAARDRHQGFARILLRFAVPIALTTAILQPILGHMHILNVLEHNPEKDAAYEGIFHSTNGATLYAFGIPDENNRVIHFGIGLPYALSFLESGNPLSRVAGLDEYPRETWPPVNVIFTTFHLMVMLGVLMIVVFAVGAYLLWRRQLFRSRWYLLLLPWLVPLPYLANELGWVGAEIGRQPWLIYKVLRTADASTNLLPAWQIAASLIGIGTFYLLLLALALYFLGRQIAKGPAAE